MGRLFDILTQSPAAFFLIFARVAAVVMLLPLFSSRSVPFLVRAALAITFSVVLYPSFGPYYNTFARQLAPPSYLTAVLGEVVLGLLLGYMTQLLFAIFQSAGQFFSTQISFSSVSMYDPTTGDQNPILGELFYFMALYIYISSGALEKGLYQSLYIYLKAVSLSSFTALPHALPSQLISLTALLFREGLALAFPMVIILGLVSLSMGLLAKASPQMNLLMVGFPIQILIGMLALLFATPYIAQAMGALFDFFFDFINSAFISMTGGDI